MLHSLIVVKMVVWKQTQGKLAYIVLLSDPRRNYGSRTITFIKIYFLPTSC
jgi:hypothetical protein